MTNKEKYKQAFSVLHASDDFSWEVNSIKQKKVLRPRRKLATACICLALTICAGVSVYAAANHFFGYSIKIGDKEISTEIENVLCSELTDEDISQKYFSISDLENKMDIDLLESSLSYDEYMVPNIVILKCDIYDSLSYTIYGLDYFVNDMKLLEEQNGDSHLWDIVGDKPFSINYQADIIVNRGQLTGMEEIIDDGEFLESYTTENGIQTEIFMFGNVYGAYVEKENVIYKFTMSSNGQVNVQNLKYFLDTLK